ncbi:MAG: hypothetical protein ABWY50_06950 [Aeromicrobium sp.]
MPTKTWVVGEEVLAADFNSYVQKQVVAQFANVAARDAALPAPTIGMLCYVADITALQIATTTAPTGWRTMWGTAVPTFRVWGGAGGQSVPQNVNTVLTYAAGASSNVGGVTVGGVFTCTAAIAGTWFFTYAASFQAHGTGARHLWLEHSNGARHGSVSGDDSLAVGMAATGSAFLTMAAGETLKVVTLHSGAGPLNMNPNANQYFQGRYLGAA